MTLLLTFLPGLLILFYFVYSDRFKEPKKIILITFILGIVIGYPAGYLNHYVARFFSNGNIINDALVGGAFAGAIVEEILKFLILYFYIFKQKEFNEPMDAIVYGAAIGLGYAAMENLGYLNSGNLETAWTLSIVKVRYIPLVMHLGFGIIMGWLLSLNLFEERSPFKRRVMLILALAVPVVMHGSYNYLRAYEVFPIITLILTIGIIYFYRREQLKRITEDMDKSKIENIDVFYSYLVSIVLVTLVIVSSILSN
jgi:RsiW-degrading membrane proteinase PrsW (M82 family)